MGVEQTLAIIKPDAVEKRVIGKIVQRIEEAGLVITAMELIEMDEKLASGFYAVHKTKPFFQDLVNFMTSGPVVVMCLEGEGAITKWRTLMGATDPAKAEAGTIRKDFGTNIERNASHGSDAPETAAFEVRYFF